MLNPLASPNTARFLHADPSCLDAFCIIHVQRGLELKVKADSTTRYHIHAMSLPLKWIKYNTNIVFIKCGIWFSMVHVKQFCIVIIDIFIFDAIQNITVTYRTTIPHDVAT